MVDPMDNMPDDAGLPGADLPGAAASRLRAELGKRFATTSIDRGELAKLDARVMAEARMHFASVAQPATGSKPQAAGVVARIGTRSVLWRIGTAAAGMAAVIALMITLPSFFADDADRSRDNPLAMKEQSARPPGAASAFAGPGDINGDGYVDVLDAYLLQRRIEAAGDLDAQWDFTRDGRIDRADVNAIATVAVKLSGGRL